LLEQLIGQQPVIGSFDSFGVLIHRRHAAQSIL
jgi:hypothetical protein